MSGKHAKIHNSLQYALLHDSESANLCNKEFLVKWKEPKSKKGAELHIELKTLPRIWVNMIPFDKLMKQYYPIHSLHLRFFTEMIIWQQIL